MNATPARQRSAHLQALDRERTAATIRSLFAAGADERQPSAAHPWSADLLRYTFDDARYPRIRDVTIRLELEYSPTTPYRALLVLTAQQNGQEAEVLRASDTGAADTPPQIERWPEDPAIGAVLHHVLFVALAEYPGAGVLPDPEGEA